MTFPQILTTADELPLGRFKTTFDVIKDKYVDAFPQSSSRSGLFDALVTSTGLLSRIVPVLSVWIAGSFASPKLDPDDIDVVYWVDADGLANMPGDDRLLLQTFTSRGGLKAAKIPLDAFVHYWHRYDLDGSPLPRLPEGYDYIMDRGRWDDAWSRSKAVQSSGNRHSSERPDRGYLEVIPDNGSTW